MDYIVIEVLRCVAEQSVGDLKISDPVREMFVIFLLLVVQLGVDLCDLVLVQPPVFDLLNELLKGQLSKASIIGVKPILYALLLEA